MNQTTNLDGVRQIRACFTDDTIIVYQAFASPIAEYAVRQQNFLFNSFKTSRMTWIKPSFFWMMYRSGWASKINQERILSITISRAGFDWALAHACLSHFDPNVHESHESWRKELESAPVRIQWDPERDAHLQPISHKRAIQIGLSGEAITKYKQEWIVRIDDITDYCLQLSNTLKAINDKHSAETLLPCRPHVYPVVRDVGVRLNLSI